MQVNMHEAKTNLSQLGERALNGEEIIIAKAGKPLFKLVPYHEETEVRKPGRLKDEIKVLDSWENADQAVLDEFEACFE